jgi:sn-glycerol 3-phosphate transport system permease protein
MRCGALGYEWNHLLNGTQAMTLIVLAAVWNQISYNFLFFLAGLQHPQEPDRGRRHRRRRPVAALLDHQFPLLSPTTFFLLVINIIYVFIGTFAIVDTATSGGPGQDTEILVYKVYYDGFKAHGPRRLGRAVGGADGHRGR